MFSIGWPELVVIAAVALVAVGPKDLPRVMRVAGRWAGKIRRAVQDVQHDFERLSYEVEAQEREEKEKTEKTEHDA